jgi:hypothetical protein
MSPSTTLPHSVGKHLITPLTGSAAAGRFVAALSIRRGRGTATHDKVYTFKPEFASAHSASAYAAAQGRNWRLNPASLC